MVVGVGVGGMCNWYDLSQLMFKTVLFPHVRGKLGHCLGQFGSLIIKTLKSELSE